MKIGILGTGVAGQTHATKLASLGHLMMGTRDFKFKIVRKG
jgi:ketopantoate reductase